MYLYTPPTDPVMFGDQTLRETGALTMLLMQERRLMMQPIGSIATLKSCCLFHNLQSQLALAIRHLMLHDFRQFTKATKCSPKPYKFSHVSESSIGCTVANLMLSAAFLCRYKDLNTQRLEKLPRHSHHDFL